MSKRNKYLKYHDGYDFNIYNSYALVYFNGRKTLKSIKQSNLIDHGGKVTLACNNTTTTSYPIHNFHELLKWIKDADYQTRLDLIRDADFVIESFGSDIEWEAIKAAAQTRNEDLNGILKELQGSKIDYLKWLIKHNSINMNSWKGNIPVFVTSYSKKDTGAVIWHDNGYVGIIEIIPNTKFQMNELFDKYSSEDIKVVGSGNLEDLKNLEGEISYDYDHCLYKIISRDIKVLNINPFEDLPKRL